MEKIKVLNLANTVGKNSGGIGNVVHALTRYGNKDGRIDSHLWFNGDETLANEVQQITGIGKKESKT